MTTVREAAQQALEALQNCANGEDDVLLTRDALANLRAALAEPVQEPDPGEYHGWVLREVLFEKGEPVGHREPMQEPVAHFGSAYVNENGVHITTVLGPVAIPQDAKLYTVPAKRKPLSEDEKRALADKFLSCQPESYEVSGVFDLISAVERAHGIGGEE